MTQQNQGVPPRDLLDPVHRLVAQAAARIIAVYRGRIHVDSKADDTPLTQADRAAHQVLGEGLPQLLDVPVLSEEGRQPRWVERRGWSCYWLVDPLDGTREFVKRNDEFSVNVALIQDGDPVLGVVQAPVTGVAWLGIKGEGAWRREDRRDTPLRTRRPPGDPMTVAVSRSHRDAPVAALLEQLPEADTRPLGSALKFCAVAEGEADLYPRFGPTSEWDTAAAQCVLEAAGGAVLDVATLRPLRYNRRDTLLNGDFIAVGDPDWPWAELLRKCPRD